MATMKRYERVSGCLDKDDANQLWHDLIKWRNAVRNGKMFARREWGDGFAIFEVIEEEVPGSVPQVA